ncbi:MAG TPA: extracellular solute-binding protein [Jiangellaceae bacterium]
MGDVSDATILSPVPVPVAVRYVPDPDRCCCRANWSSAAAPDRRRTGAAFPGGNRQRTNRRRQRSHGQDTTRNPAARRPVDTAPPAHRRLWRRRRRRQRRAPRRLGRRRRGRRGRGTDRNAEAVALRRSEQRDGHRLGSGDRDLRGNPPGRHGRVRGEGLRADPGHRPDGAELARWPGHHGVQQGQRHRRPLSSQGLLADLSEPAEERGWPDMLSSSLQTTAIYEDGVMGSGNWYGVPNYGEFVLVYYNQEMFDEHGVEVPTTLEEFEAAMDTFVDAGITPLAVGGAEYPAQQIWYQLSLANADREFVNVFQLYEGDVDFHGPEMTAGAEKFVEWLDAGYISSDAAGIPAEDMGVSFTSGEYPILISGTWWFGRFVDEIDFDWGTFLFPGTDLYLGSSGNLWVVSERSENKELAYDFIDITMSEDIQNLLGNNGGIPVAADPDAITDERSRELIENFNTVVENDGLAFYPDWPAPGYYDTLVAGVQAHRFRGGGTGLAARAARLRQPAASRAPRIRRAARCCRRPARL